MKKLLLVNVFVFFSVLTGFTLSQTNSFILEHGVSGIPPENPAGGVLKYDHGIGDLLGFPGGGNSYIAARFPRSITSQYLNTAITHIEIYIGDLPEELILKVWDAGTDSTAGDEIFSKDVRNLTTPNSYNTYALDIDNPIDSAIVINGNDLWIGYEVTMLAGQTPLGLDNGPLHPDGDWLGNTSCQYCWYHLSDYNILQNWVIRAYLNPIVTADLESEFSPSDFSLSQNYPNPFNPVTTINYKLPENGFVTLKVYDVLGNEVAELVNEEKPAGKYEVNFDASGISSGIYYYILRSGLFSDTKKMILMK